MLDNFAKLMQNNLLNLELWILFYSKGIQVGHLNLIDF
jgi:hypothetical protein